LPEQRVICLSTALISDLRSNPRREAVQALQQLFYRKLGNRWISGNGRVEVVYVCLIMLVVVDLPVCVSMYGSSASCAYGSLGRANGGSAARGTVAAVPRAANPNSDLRVIISTALPSPTVQPVSGQLDLVHG
jgi:hypothetical protein